MSRRRWPNVLESAWRWIKKVYLARSLVKWLGYVPDPRSGRKKKHDQVEILICIIIGFLNGKTTLRRIKRWCEKHLNDLRRYSAFSGGIASVSTMSRLLRDIDEELLSLMFASWIGEILSTRGIHIAIDGKGLRAAANKLRDGRTPYILNALDVTTKLVVAQIAIREKTNEMTAIPELIQLIDIEGSTITIDAIGATANIMDQIGAQNGDFVLQVKKNCPNLYQELMDLFAGLKRQKKEDPVIFEKKSQKYYDEYHQSEHNRDRYEYRDAAVYFNEDDMKPFQEERSHVLCVGFIQQVRIKQINDENGNDVTPSLPDFMKSGSKKQPRPVVGDEMDDDIQRIGMIASRVLSAKEMAQYKRNHWAVENSLHYVLDNTFGEDRCTVRNGKNALAVLRKFAYNIVRLLQIREKSNLTIVGDVIDDLQDDFNLIAQYVFKPIPGFIECEEDSEDEDVA